MVKARGRCSRRDEAFQNGFDRAGDLVWSYQDLGAGPSFRASAARECDFWRTVRAWDLPARAVSYNEAASP